LSIPIRGAHHRWPGRLTRISEAKLVRSISRNGCSQNNAACEGFFSRMKTVIFYPRDWKAIALEQFVAEVDAYIRCYNEKRIKISLNKRALAHILFQFYRSDLNTCRLVRRISVC